MNITPNIYKHITSTLFFVLLFVSCQQDNITHPQLLMADALVKHRPDSAIILLENIREPDKLKKEEQAFYALLLTQAQYKSGKTFTDVSLIQIAVNHYENGTDVYHEAQSFYYLACVYEDMGNIALSLEALQKAEELLNETYKNDRLLYLIQSNKTNQYRKQGFYDEAMLSGRKSYENCIARNDSADILYALDDIASVYTFLGKKDSASVYFRKGAEIAEIQRDSSWLASFFDDMAKILYSQGNYPEARRYITKAINYEPDKEERLLYYHTKGDILNNLGEKDSARHFMSKSLPSRDINTRYHSYLVLFSIEQEAGHLQRATEYSKAYMALTDSMYQINTQAEITRLVNDYTITAHMKKIAFKEKRKLTRTVVLCVFALILMTLIYMLIDKRRKSYILKLQAQLKRKHELLLFKQEKEDHDIIVNEGSKSDILKRICINTMLTNTELFKQHDAYKEILMMNGSSDKKILFPSKKRNHLKEVIYEIFPDTLLSLKELYDLTPDETYFCILHSLNLSNTTIAACLGISEGAVRTRKSRIRKKMGEEFTTVF